MLKAGFLHPEILKLKIKPQKESFFARLISDRITVESLLNDLKIGLKRDEYRPSSYRRRTIELAK